MKSYYKCSARSCSRFYFEFHLRRVCDKDTFQTESSVSGYIIRVFTHLRVRAYTTWSPEKIFGCLTFLTWAASENFYWWKFPDLRYKAFTVQDSKHTIIHLFGCQNIFMKWKNRHLFLKIFCECFSHVKMQITFSTVHYSCICCICCECFHWSYLVGELKRQTASLQQFRSLASGAVN